MHMLGPRVHDEISNFLALHFGEDLPVRVGIRLSEIDLDVTDLGRSHELPKLH